MKVKVEEHERRVEEVENQMEQKSEDWAKEKESIETEAKLNHLVPLLFPFLSCSFFDHLMFVFVFWGHVTTETGRRV